MVQKRPTERPDKRSCVPFSRCHCHHGLLRLVDVQLVQDDSDFTYNLAQADSSCVNYTQIIIILPDVSPSSLPGEHPLVYNVVPSWPHSDWSGRDSILPLETSQLDGKFHPISCIGAGKHAGIDDIQIVLDGVVNVLELRCGERPYKDVHQHQCERDVDDTGIVTPWLVRFLVGPMVVVWV